MRVLTLLGSSVALVFLFQNCSKVEFASDSASKTSPGVRVDLGENVDSLPSAGAFEEAQEGLNGGHFDLDTSSQVYLPMQGKTDHHVHEYDDKYQVTYADFFALLDPNLSNINEQVATDTRFVLIIANAELSPGGVLSINGKLQSVQDYQKRVDAFLNGDPSALPVFTLSGANDQQLVDLKIGFSPDTLARGGLVGTQTSCVVHNDPGKLGEYRNGALIIQAIDVSLFKINRQTRTAETNGGLLWESTLFWHWDKPCYQ